MKETTDFNLREYSNDLDQIAAGVMPDSWEGHARITIYESEAVPERMVEKATNKAVSLAESNGTTPEKAASLLVKNMAESKE